MLPHRWKVVLSHGSERCQCSLIVMRMAEACFLIKLRVSGVREKLGHREPDVTSFDFTMRSHDGSHWRLETQDLGLYVCV